MKKLFNENLISLKCVIFLFLTGAGCLFPFLPAHMLAIQFSVKEACIVSIVIPCIATLGPLLAGPIADKLSVGRGCDVNTVTTGDANNAGSKVLRIMLVICLISAAVFYGLLLAVPSVKILEPRRPSVSFMCNADNATVYQEMCTEEKQCNHWKGEKTGSLLLSNCRYACEKTPIAHPLYIELTSTTESSDSDDYDSDPDPESTINEDSEDEDKARLGFVTGQIKNAPPHLCYTRFQGEPTICHVFTDKQIVLNTGLLSAIEDNYEAGNESSWCKYPIGGRFQCLVPQFEIETLQEKENLIDNSTCKPVIECNVDDPYESKESVLAESQCKLFIGDPVASFWLYLTFRSLADLFAAAALCLICTACIIATRETSLGRSDVGRQFAFGILGTIVFPPIIGALQDIGSEESPIYLAPIITAVCFFLLAAIILIIDTGMPLTPPEWWWHTKSGMLALPMNTVRRYGLETVGVVIVLVILGSFWGALDSYLSWTMRFLNGNHLLIGIGITLRSIPALLVLWKAEKVIDYVGHSNVFIGAFAFYIIRFTGLALIDSGEWILLCEIFDVFTLSLTWITGILYFRHLIPRRFTATGQALAVSSHFCFGRFFGALMGLPAAYDNPLKMLQITYMSLAISACILGVIYLVLYHLLLAPMCRAGTTGPPNPEVMQGLNSNGASNGSYTPLRVYHNERGRKGQFRY